jgi:hypothetical protein
MALSVNPEHLISTANSVDGLGKQVDGLPALAADAVATTFRGTNFAEALSGSDPSDTQVRTVLKGRLSELSRLLRYSAEHYTGTDRNTAARIAALGDLNSGALPTLPPSHLTAGPS